jgi:hypothetical protein
MKRKSKSIIAILIAMAIMSIVAVGCSKQKSVSSENKANMPSATNDIGFGSNNNSSKDEAKQEISSNNDSTKNGSKTENSPNDLLKTSLAGQGKIIQNGIIQMETLGFDETVEHILSKTSSVGGYVQGSNVSGRSIEANSYEERRRGQFTLRIPKTKFDGFILDVGSLGSITSKQISTDDVTSAYFDTQAHLKSLIIQEERLIELLKKTGELKDIIVVEKELTSVRYEIEGLTGNLKKWDNLIDFCTLNIELSEVNKIKENPISFGDKIVNGFVDSVKSLIDIGKGFIVIMSVCMPYLVILSIVLLISRYIFIHSKKN